MSTARRFGSPTRRFRTVITTTTTQPAMFTRTTTQPTTVTTTTTTTTFTFARTSDVPVPGTPRTSTSTAQGTPIVTMADLPGTPRVTFSTREGPEQSDVACVLTTPVITPRDGTTTNEVETAVLPADSKVTVTRETIDPLVVETPAPGQPVVTTETRSSGETCYRNPSNAEQRRNACAA